MLKFKNNKGKTVMELSEQDDTIVVKDKQLFDKLKESADGANIVFDDSVDEEDEDEQE